MRSSPSFTHLFILSSNTLIQTVYVLYVFIGPVFLNFRHLLVSFLSSLKGFFRYPLNCFYKQFWATTCVLGTTEQSLQSAGLYYYRFLCLLLIWLGLFIMRAYQMFFCTHWYHHVISVLYLYGLLTLLLCIGWTGIGSLEWNLLLCAVWSLRVLEFSFKIFCNKFYFHVHQGN